jgi:outer membrane biosynthesis protein TonB
MVKEPVRRAASSGAAKKSGGALLKFFAEENEFDRRALLRIGTWGAAAVGAVTIAVMANQSSLSLRRDRSAAAELTRQAQQIQSLTREGQNETRRLAAAIDTLNSDRDRLFSRVTILEEGLESVTGALTRQSAALAKPPVATASVPPASPVDPQQAVQNQPAATTVAVAPQVDPVSTADAFIAARPRMDLPKVEPAPAPNPAQAAAQSPAPAPNPPATRQAAVAPQPAPPPALAPANSALVAARSMIGPPDRAASKLVEPAKPASTANATQAQAPANAPATEPAPAASAKDSAAAKFAAVARDASPRDKIDVSPRNMMPPKEAIVAKDSDGPETGSPDVAVRRTEFAIDLGSANSVGGLRALWRGLSKSNPQLAALSPIIVIKESNTGLGMQLHLAAGPLGDAAAAAKICATLTDGDRSCETTVFDGQRLAMQGDETSSVPQASGSKPPPPPKPSYNRRYPAKHLAKKEEPAPPKPVEAPPPPASSTSSFSTLFKR